MPSTTRKSKVYYHDIYRKTSHADRIGLIYNYAIHNVSLKKLADKSVVSYNSIRNYVEAYKATGRTNRMNFKTVLFQRK